MVLQQIGYSHLKIISETLSDHQSRLSAWYLNKFRPLRGLGNSHLGLPGPTSNLPLCPQSTAKHELIRQRRKCAKGSWTAIQKAVSHMKTKKKTSSAGIATPTKPNPVELHRTKTPFIIPYRSVKLLQVEELRRVLPSSPACLLLHEANWYYPISHRSENECTQ
jgi:hypothetical protein